MESSHTSAESCVLRPRDARPRGNAEDTAGCEILLRELDRPMTETGYSQAAPRSSAASRYRQSPSLVDPCHDVGERGQKQLGRHCRLIRIPQQPAAEATFWPSCQNGERQAADDIRQVALMDDGNLRKPALLQQLCMILPSVMSRTSFNFTELRQNSFAP